VRVKVRAGVEVRASARARARARVAVVVEVGARVGWSDGTGRRREGRDGESNGGPSRRQASDVRMPGMLCKCELCACPRW